MFVARSKGREKRNVSSRPCAHYFKQQSHYAARLAIYYNIIYSSVAQRVIKKGRDDAFFTTTISLDFKFHEFAIHSISRALLLWTANASAHNFQNDGFREGRVFSLHRELKKKYYQFNNTRIIIYVMEYLYDSAIQVFENFKNITKCTTT